jgi:hypothetical protein
MHNMIVEDEHDIHDGNFDYVFYFIMYFLLLRIFRHFLVIVAMYFLSFNFFLLYFYIFIIFFKYLLDLNIY